MKTSQEWREYFSRMWFGGSGVPQESKFAMILADMEALERENDSLRETIAYMTQGDSY